MAKKEVNKEVKKTNKNNDKNKKSFFKSFKVELKKVVWPTPKQLVNSTVTVITIVLICTAIVFILDLAFEAMNKQGIDKLKEVMTTQSNTTSENTQSEQNTNIVDTNTATEGNETQTPENTGEQTVVENVQNNETTPTE